MVQATTKAIGHLQDATMGVRRSSDLAEYFGLVMAYDAAYHKLNEESGAETPDFSKCFQAVQSMSTFLDQFQGLPNVTINGNTENGQGK